jgi:acetolactate synthase-1/2/3 large subunit
MPYAAKIIFHSAPDFAAVARAYGVSAWKVADPSELAAAISECGSLAGPCLIQVGIDPTLNAYPKMAFGRPFGSMEPDVASTEMEGT